MLTRIAATAALLIGLMSLSPAAFAAGGVVCDTNGNCKVVVESPGTPGGGNGGGTTVPASTSTGSQVTPEQWAAYLARLRAEQKALLNDASTQTCSGGATYIAQYGTCGAYATPQDPADPPAPPTWTPWMAAQSALEQLTLTKPQIGTAPPCTAAVCKGYVGVPVWLWTEPWQQQSVTATAGPFQVTAVARVASVRWDLGDGTAFTCATSGTAYDISMGFTASPDCGNARGYQRAGTYTISATYTWNVTWSGATSGSTTINTTSSTAPLPVTEIQAIVTAAH